MVFAGNGSLLVLNSPPTCIPCSYPVKSKVNDQIDNHDGVITHVEPDILEYESSLCGP